MSGLRVFDIKSDFVAQLAKRRRIRKGLVDNFADQSDNFQLEALKAIEQYLMTKSQIDNINDFVHLASQTTDPINDIVCAHIKEALTGRATNAADLAKVRARIKELERDIREKERTKKMSTACEGLRNAIPWSLASGILQPNNGNKKRKLDVFDGVVKHAQSVLDLHKKLREEESTDTDEPAATDGTKAEG